MKNIYDRRFLGPTAALLVAATLLFLLPVSGAEAGHPHQRDGWLIGVGYGYGRGRLQVPEGGQEYSFHGGVTPQIRCGRMVGRQVSLQVEYGAWMFEDGIIPLKARISMQDLVLGATWYPGNPDHAWGGFQVRVGAGLGWASVAGVVLNEELEQVLSGRLDEWGLGLQASAGYEWRFAPDVAAGVGVSVHHLGIDGVLYRQTTFVPLTCGLTWYWD